MICQIVIRRCERKRVKNMGMEGKTIRKTIHRKLGFEYLDWMLQDKYDGTLL